MMMLNACQADSSRASASSRQVGSCKLESTPVPEREIPPVRRVVVYWDVSGSMSGFLKANAKHQGQLALKSLWNQLDREWIRAASPTVDEVLHRTIGERIAKLDDSRKLPPLIANWSALPQAAFQIGKLLASDPTSAVVLVSDMRVDTPLAFQSRLDAGTFPACLESALSRHWRYCPRVWMYASLMSENLCWQMGGGHCLPSYGVEMQSIRLSLQPT
jgi:hypothetical protein